MHFVCTFVNKVDSPNLYRPSFSTAARRTFLVCMVPVPRAAPTSRCPSIGVQRHPLCRHPAQRMPPFISSPLPKAQNIIYKRIPLFRGKPCSSLKMASYQLKCINYQMDHIWLAPGRLKNSPGVLIGSQCSRNLYRSFIVTLYVSGLAAPRESSREGSREGSRERAQAIAQERAQ